MCRQTQCGATTVQTVSPWIQLCADSITVYPEYIKLAQANNIKLGWLKPQAWLGLGLHKFWFILAEFCLDFDKIEIYELSLARG